MPWSKDQNGERKYTLSLYTKEDLPTWSEVYNEWYKEGHFFYDPSVPEWQKEDPYWKIPHYKYLQATVCNQFNKMLFEDRLREPLIKFINDASTKMYKVTDVRFSLEEVDDYLRNHDEDELDPDEYVKSQEDLYNKLNVGKPDIPPPIYTLTMPNGKRNPFIVNDHPRINVDDLNGVISVFPVLRIDMDSDIFVWSTLDPRKIARADKYDINKTRYSMIINYLLHEFVQYFEDGVGWKDKDGNLIDNIPQPKVEPDPAL